MSPTPPDLPADTTYGFVMGQVTFAPVEVNRKSTTPNPAMVIGQPIPCEMDTEGYILDPAGNRGVWLIAGRYVVSYANPREFHVDHSPLCMIGRSNSHRR